MPMDDDVIKAMTRWPNVPAAWGWLRIDRRGHWFIVKRDTPDFNESRDGIGSIVRNERLIDFMARNYNAEPNGAWYFQNGPQRVFVDCELAPLVWRVEHEQDQLRWVAHTGAIANETLAVAVDVDGNVYIKTELGPGVIDDRQLARLDQWLRENDDGSMQLLTNRVTSTYLPVALNSEPALLWGFEKAPRPAT
jgi:Protein of unknown function (DUF2946)